MEKKFKCKDEVIFRRKISFGNGTLYTWDYGVVTYEDKGIIHLVGGIYVSYREYDILPYEGNEHLVGTPDSPYGERMEVELEEGEIIFASNDRNMLYDCIGVLERFKEVSGNKFVSYNYDKYDFAIRFSDFNPKDMEETEKHILCVKNGRIVYKG